MVERSAASTKRAHKENNMASKIIERIKTKAEALYQLRQAISEKEEANRKELDVMKLDRDTVQAELLAELKKNDLASIKVGSGDSFIRQSRKSLDVVSEAHALKWAMDNRAVSINKIIAMQKIKDLEEVPPGFDVVETEFISVRKAKDE